LQSSYLICSGPRTGSNLLASTLRSVNVAGQPYEYFSADMKDTPFMLELLGIQEMASNPPGWPERMPFILSCGTGENGIFGATLHNTQISELLAAIGMPNLDWRQAVVSGPQAIKDYFPNLKLIALRRRNTVAQTISHHIARETGRWQVEVAQPPVESDGHQQVLCDFEAITDLCERARKGNEMWDAFLSPLQDRVLPITYEELDGAFADTVQRVLAFLGVRCDPDAVTPQLRKQRDERSLEWERQYREFAALPVGE
jgi:trehalose 2-sulfotransferase